jgi:aspartyl-tRNA(Asn)/glutamyl-tRNA(Gln) amidotransferase subunit A
MDKGARMAELISRPLTEIARALRDQTGTAQELVEQAIARHDRFGERLHAYCQWTPERARGVAQAADAAFTAGAVAGPLQGMPVSIKDLFAAEGFACFAGSTRRLPADPWERDGPLVATLRRQLGVITGKTHMVEFAFGGTGLNSHHGAPYNPWGGTAHRSPGGSSSGAGVSLLEGSAVLALGSDTAGSVRIPASMTGTVGLKVTLGRWSTDGVVPLSRSFDTPGLLARSVADAAYGFAALDPGLGDAEGFLARCGALSLDRVRIAVDDALFWDDCDPGIAEAARDAVAALARGGAVLRATNLPEAADAYAVFLEGGVSAIELRSFLDQELPDWLGQLDPIMAPAVHAAEALSAREYLARLGRLRVLARRAATRFDGIDVMATPTLCITPPVLADIASPEGYLSTNRRIVRNTVAVNYLGLCGVTLPVGLDRAGMPVGLQFIAPAWAEETLLAVALAAERALGTALERLGTPPMLAT